jgi:hypothetical protein
MSFSDSTFAYITTTRIETWRRWTGRLVRLPHEHNVLQVSDLSTGIGYCSSGGGRVGETMIGAGRILGKDFCMEYRVQRGDQGQVIDWHAQHAKGYFGSETI